MPALRHALRRRAKHTPTALAPILLVIGAVAAGAAAAWQTRADAAPVTVVVPLSAFCGAVSGGVAGVVHDLGLPRRLFRYAALWMRGKRPLIVRCQDLASASAAKQLLAGLGAERVR